MRILGNKENGSAVLFLLIFIAVMSIYAIHTRKFNKDTDSEILARQYSDNIQQICSAAETKSTREWAAILASGGADWSIDDLRGTPPLPNDFTAALNGATASAKVLLSPSGCVSSSCLADIRVSTTSLLKNGIADMALVGRVTKRLGKNAYVSTPDNPAIFQGQTASLQESNSTGVAGAILYKCGEANTQNNTLSMKGNTKLEGAWGVGGHDITGISQAQASQIELGNTAAAAGACTEQNAVELGPDGLIYRCDGSNWVSASKQTTNTVSEDVYQTVN